MFLDLVIWGLYSPTLQSLKTFLQEPTWLTLKVWQRYQENQVKQTNFNSVATAKMSLLLEMGLSSFGGGSSKVEQNIERYLPFNWVVNDEKVSQDTADIFWECVKEGLVPNYVERAFGSNQELINSLKAKKRG